MEYWKNLDLKDIEYLNEENHLVIEKWLDIEDYDGYYQVSNLGRVKFTGKSFTDSIGRLVFKRARIRIQTINRRGYLCLVLRKRGKNVLKTVHRLVAETFISNIDNKCCVNHLDSVKTNNPECNLEWCTIRENSKHWIENDISQSSNFIGVTFTKAINKWAANISIEGKVYNLGKYDIESIAYEKYTEALKNWENFKTKPAETYRSPNLSSVYEGVYYNTNKRVWCGQFKVGDNFFFVGNYSTELEAKEARDIVVENYNATGIFPTKKYASKYMHVTWKESIGKWQVRVPLNGKRPYIGVYRDEDEAGEVVKATLNLKSKLYKKNHKHD